MLKDSIIRYVKEHTGKTDLRALDTTLTANDIADHFKVKRNTVSLYLNQEVGKTLFKINTRPVRFLDKGEFERRFFPVSKDIYDSVKELLDEDETAPAEEEHYSKDDEAVEKITEMLKKVSDSITMDQINNSLVHNFSMNRLMGFLTILDTEKILNYIETALDEYEFITGKKLKNSTRISCCIHVGCLVERLIRNAAIGNYPSQEEFEQIHRVDIEQIQQVFSVIEQTYRVKIPVSEIGYIYDILTEI